MCVFVRDCCKLADENQSHCKGDGRCQGHPHTHRHRQGFGFVMKSDLAELFTSPVHPVMIYYLSPFLASECVPVVAVFLQPRILPLVSKIIFAEQKYLL